MDQKFGNHEIFQNIDVGEGFGHQNRPNVLVGANFIACGAAVRLGAGAAAAPE